MTTYYKTRAFVFKKNDSNESDRVFSIFTDNFGKIDIYAKAIRKSVSKLRSGIDIFSVSDIEFVQGKNRKTLIDAQVVKKFRNLTQSLERFGIANKIAQVLDNFLKGQEKDERIFELLEETFTRLNSCRLRVAGCGLLYYFFLWNFLSLLGYKPEVEKCNVCSQKLNPYNIYFSEKLGGTTCKKCLNNDLSAIKINSDVVKILRLIFKKDLGVLLKLKISRASQDLFQSASDNYYSFLLPR